MVLYDEKLFIRIGNISYMSHRYLNVYIHGDKKRLPTLINAISKAVRDGWQVADQNRTRVSPDEAHEYRYTANHITGFLRFFCSADRPYVLYLRDSGIIGSDSPITLQDNDYLVRHFVSSVLKPACSELDMKIQVTRSVMH